MKVIHATAVALALAAPLTVPQPAGAGWFDGALGAVSSFFGSGSVTDMFGVSGGGSTDWDAFAGPGGSVDGRAAIEAQRAAAATAAAAAGAVPALLGAQILQQTELRIATDLQWRMVESLNRSHAPAAQATGREVRSTLGSQGVAWEPGGALAQHRSAFVEPMGDAVASGEAVRQRMARMVSLKTAAGEELASALAAQGQAGDEDAATLRAMLDAAMGANGPTQAVQALAQLNALLIEKVGQQQATNAAFQKFILAQGAADEFERHIALTQRARGARDMMDGQPFGVPNNDGLTGEAAVAGLPSLPGGVLPTTVALPLPTAGGESVVASWFPMGGGFGRD